MRGHGEGTISQRKDGRWQAQITLEGGQRKRKTFYGKTKKEVQEKLRVAINEQKQGTLATGQAQILKVYLLHWIDDVHKSSVTTRTYLSYRASINNHIIPALGDIAVQKLTPQHLQSFYAHKLEEGLSAKTVNRFHMVLHQALDNAVRWNIVSRNVCKMVTRPREVRYEIQPLTEVQARKLLDAVKGDVLEGIITLALVVGLRRGELLGLKWDDVDFEGKFLLVRRSAGRVGTLGIIESDPKTTKSRRKIMLPDFVIDVLKRHRERQLVAKAELGSKWQDSGYIFTNSQGGFLVETQLYNLYKRLLKRAELPNIRFHDLRHSAATIMISMGVNVKVVQEVLGHSKINMTLDTYTHVLPSMQQDAIQRLDTLYGKK